MVLRALTIWDNIHKVQSYRYQHGNVSYNLLSLLTIYMLFTLAIKASSMLFIPRPAFSEHDQTLPTSVCCSGSFMLSKILKSTWKRSRHQWALKEPPYVLMISKRTVSARVRTSSLHLHMSRKCYQGSLAMWYYYFVAFISKTR